MNDEIKITSQYKQPEYKAKIVICENLTIMLVEKPNILQKAMYKFLLGWKVSEVSNE